MNDNFFKEIFENSKSGDANPDAILTIRLIDGIVINVNTAFAKQLGYSRDKLIGKNCNELNLLVNPIQFKDSRLESTEKNLRDGGAYVFPCKPTQMW